MKRWGDRFVLVFLGLMLAPFIVTVAAQLLVLAVESVAPVLGWVLLGAAVAWWFGWGGPRRRGGGYR